MGPPPRTSEIAGAGFAGLAIGALLARAGWKVRIHERSEADRREIGAGIFLHNNGLLVLEDLGVIDRLRPLGVRLERDQMIDGNGLMLQNRSLVGPARTWSFPRQGLIDVLQHAAIEHGAEVITGDTAVSATPEGTMTLADGTVLKADLIVGADGHRSRIRSSLGIEETAVALPTASLRFMIPGRELAPEPITTENWSGKRRVAFAPCAPDAVYVYMACPAEDPAAAEPLDADLWVQTFPRLRDKFDVLAVNQPYCSTYTFVRCSSWSAGRTVVVGDAAHALAPTLGQGTNLALSNVRSLISYLETGGEDVRSALRIWEQAVRPVTDATQAWASRYDRLTKHWPPALVRVRRAVIRSFGTVPALDHRLRIADRTPPVTAA